MLILPRLALLTLVIILTAWGKRLEKVHYLCLWGVVAETSSIWIRQLREKTPLIWIARFKSWQLSWYTGS